MAAPGWWYTHPEFIGLVSSFDSPDVVAQFRRHRWSTPFKTEIFFSSFDSQRLTSLVKFVDGALKIFSFFENDSFMRAIRPFIRREVSFARST